MLKFQCSGMSSHADVGRARKGESDPGDVSPVPLSSKESHDPPTLKSGRWLRAKSLRSIATNAKRLK
ncbi:MAG: hypothetical protein ACP5HQ_06915 [Thermoprotei archaeon]